MKTSRRIALMAGVGATAAALAACGGKPEPVVTPSLTPSPTPTPSPTVTPPPAGKPLPPTGTMAGLAIAGAAGMTVLGGALLLAGRRRAES